MNMLSPLANRTYAQLFSAQLIALIGTGVTTVALALLAYELAGKDAGQVLGIALAIKMVAYVCLSPLAGSIAPRFSRRSYLVVLDIARAGLVLCLPFVTAAWQIYLLVFLMQICSAAFVPVFQATIPDVLDSEEEYTKALSLSRLAYDLENLASPTLAAIALLFISFEALFAVNAVAFLISAGLIVTATLPADQAPRTGGAIWSKTLFGVHAYLLTPRLRGLLAGSMVAAAGGAMVLVNTVVFARGLHAEGEHGTAILLAAFGTGSMAAAFATPTLLAYVSEKIVMISGGILITLSLAATSFLPTYIWMLVLWATIGCGYSAIQLLSGRLLRRSSDIASRPSYFAAHFALSHFCWLITYPLAGLLGSNFGLAFASTVLCCIAVAATAMVILHLPHQDAIELEHVHQATTGDHDHVHDEHHQHDHKGWEGPEPHRHPHYHSEIRHRHHFVIDDNHTRWPHRN